jgi:hypothetical protein
MPSLRGSKQVSTGSLARCPTPAKHWRAYADGGMSTQHYYSRRRFIRCNGTNNCCTDSAEANVVPDWSLGMRARAAEDR